MAPPTLTRPPVEVDPIEGLAGELMLAELAQLALEVPTRPARRVAVWVGVMVVGAVVLVAASLGALHRGGAGEGCLTGTDLTLGGATPANTDPAALSAEQRANAQVVVATGRQMGVPDRGIWVALAVALQESRLRNLPGGDRDSLGLFQQRPSQGWGSAQQIQDPVYASTQFYRHLLAVPGWEQMPLVQAAQTVQRSAFPDAYTQWETLAARLLTQAGGAAPQPCQPTDMPASGQVAAVLAMARAQLGKPYVWGATGPNSYDCSGLVLTAWKAAGVVLPRTAAAQAGAGTRIPLDQLQPGDLLFWSYNDTVPAVHHVALYLGDGQIIEAPDVGKTVSIRPVHFPGTPGTGDRELMPFGIRPASPLPTAPPA